MQEGAFDHLHHDDISLISLTPTYFFWACGQDRGHILVGGVILRGRPILTLVLSGRGRRPLACPSFGSLTLTSRELSKVFFFFPLSFFRPLGLLSPCRPGTGGEVGTHER